MWLLSKTVPDEFKNAFSRCRGAFLGVALFSALINILGLTSSIYMLQLYDRVIPSHSVPTLVGLTIMMLILFAAYGLLDVVRTRIMSRIGLRFERELRPRVIGLVLTLPLRTKGGEWSDSVRDLDAIRNFLSGAGPLAFLDMPWMFFYLGFVYLLHPWLGILATAGAALLLGLTILTDLRSRAPTKSSSISSAKRNALTGSGWRNAEVLRALGMQEQFTKRWLEQSESSLGSQLDATDVATTYGTLSKVLRYVLQSTVLGLGAYLVVVGQASGGVMIAASILTSRALAPIEIAIANWRSFVAARQSIARLSHLFAALPERKAAMALPPPRTSLAVENVWVAAPGRQAALIQNCSFDLTAGAGLGIIGPSAAGKSTLARALVGAWPLLRGSVRLDGASLDQWTPDALGRNIGYLPQGIELIDGTVMENVARLDAQPEPLNVIEAAKAAGVHDMVLALPDGYETRVGEGGTELSAGQRQRIGLARALYGNPFLVVLDEPNSNLDMEGDNALTAAIKGVRARGGIAIVIAHRPSALSAIDQLLVLGGGQIQALGPKDEVLRKVTQPAATRLRVLPETQRSDQ